MPQLPGSGPMPLSESNFNRNHTNRSSLSGGGTPPGGDRGGHGSAHSTPSSEFSSQQNWSFEEQFKQVILLTYSHKCCDEVIVITMIHICQLQIDYICYEIA